MSQSVDMIGESEYIGRKVTPASMARKPASRPPCCSSSLQGTSCTPPLHLMADGCRNPRYTRNQLLNPRQLYWSQSSGGTTCTPSALTGPPEG